MGNPMVDRIRVLLEREASHFSEVAKGRREFDQVAKLTEIDREMPGYCPCLCCPAHNRCFQGRPEHVLVVLVEYNVRFQLSRISENNPGLWTIPRNGYQGGELPHPGILVDDY